MAKPHVERVPPHMRNLERGIAGFELRDVARDPVQAVNHFMLEASRRHELRANANAEKGFASLTHSLVHRLDHTGNAIKSAPANRERPDARQHDMVGGQHVLRPRRDADLATQTGLARGALEGLARRMQIAGTVVDYGDAHRMLR